MASLGGKKWCSLAVPLSDAFSLSCWSYLPSEAPNNGVYHLSTIPSSTSFLSLRLLSSQPTLWSTIVFSHPSRGVIPLFGRLFPPQRRPLLTSAPCTNYQRCPVWINSCALSEVLTQDHVVRGVQAHVRSVHVLVLIRVGHTIVKVHVQAL